MLKWLWNWLDGLDGNVDGAVFGLGKAVAKLDKAVEANKRQSVIAVVKSRELKTKAETAWNRAAYYESEADRAKRIKTKVEELLK